MRLEAAELLAMSGLQASHVSGQEAIRARPSRSLARALGLAVAALVLGGGPVRAEGSGTPGAPQAVDGKAPAGGGLFDSLQQMKPAAAAPDAVPAAPADPAVAPVAAPADAARSPVPRPPSAAQPLHAAPPARPPSTGGELSGQRPPTATARPAVNRSQQAKPRPARSQVAVRSQQRDRNPSWRIERGEAAGWRIIR